MKMSELYEMSNLFSNSSGVENVTIWISSKNANHGPRVKAVFSNKAKELDNSISIDLEGNLVAGKIPDGKTKSFNNIKKYVKLNKSLLLKLWNFEIDSSEYLHKHLKVEG